MLHLRGCVLVGHSLGAAVALALAARRLDLAAAVCCVDGGLYDPKLMFGASWWDAQPALRPVDRHPEPRQLDQQQAGEREPEQWPGQPHDLLERAARDHLHRHEAGGATLGILVEIDIGMARCGVPPGEQAVALAQRIHKSPGLRFDGLQGYDGHLQLIADQTEKRAKCLAGLEQLVSTRRYIEKAGIAVPIVTG